MTTGFLVGVFDLFHAGHLAVIEAAAARCDRLIVGVVRDAAVAAHKGANRPIVPYAERARIVGALGVVSAVVPMPSFDPSFMARSADVLFLGEDQYHVDASAFAAVIILPRTEGVSTSKRVTQIRENL
jgi:glycerol-3-phosphate cytidylyltransferase